MVYSISCKCILHWCSSRHEKNCSKVILQNKFCLGHFSTYPLNTSRYLNSFQICFSWTNLLCFFCFMLTLLVFVFITLLFLSTLTRNSAKLKTKTRSHYLADRLILAVECICAVHRYKKCACQFMVAGNPRRLRLKKNKFVRSLLNKNRFNEQINIWHAALSTCKL